MKIKFLGTNSRAKMAHPRLSIDSLTPPEVLKKFFKYLFVLQLLQIKVFGKSTFWGNSLKISKDYLGRGDTVSILKNR